MCPRTDALCLEGSRRISLFRTLLSKSGTNVSHLLLNYLWQKRNAKDKANENFDSEQRKTELEILVLV